MKLEKIGLFILCLTFGFLSCSKSDNGSTDEVTIVIRDRTEQQLADKDSLNQYLKEHYYNKSVFNGNSNPEIADLVISSTDGLSISEDADSLLINAVESRTTVFAETDYEYYILRLNQGGGADSPTFADNIRVLYEGYTLDADVNNLSEAFDSKVTPFDIDLVSTMGGVFAWTKVFPTFNTAESSVENNDGTISYMNHGSGVMFVPSGLSYYQNATSSIPAYSPVIFKFDLLQMIENDHDNDGVPSYLEDLNNDGIFTLNSEAGVFDGDDTDENGTPNYFDPDDDGDGVPTINEDINGDGDPTNDDTDGDGIPNYLDSDSIESNKQN